MTPDHVGGLLCIGVGIGIIIGAGLTNTRLVVAAWIARTQRNAALRHARIAANTAYKSAVAAQIAEHDLYLMGGPR